MVLFNYIYSVVLTLVPWHCFLCFNTTKVSKFFYKTIVSTKKSKLFFYRKCKLLIFR